MELEDGLDDVLFFYHILRLFLKQPLLFTSSHPRLIVIWPAWSGRMKALVTMVGYLIQVQ